MADVEEAAAIPHGADAPAYPIGSVERALKLILLVAGGNPVSLAEASEHLGVARSSAHRVFQMLHYYRFVEQDPATKRYVPGPALLGIGYNALLREGRVHAILTALVDEIDETCHLAALQESKAVTQVSVECSHLLRVGNRAGHATPVHVSAAGNVLISELSAAERDAILPAEMEQADRERLSQELSTVRERGYAQHSSRVEDGVAALAFPVRGKGRQIVFSLGVTFPETRVSLAEARATFVEPCLAAAGAISRLFSGA